MWLDLYEEYCGAVRSTTEAQVRWALARGVPPGILAEAPGPFAFMRVRTSPDGTFCPDPGGVGALLVPVTEYVSFWSPDEIYDIAAWVPTEPGRTYTRRLDAWALGRERLDRAVATGEPLRVNANPLTWLADGRRGIVILDWDAPLRDRLRSAAQLDAESSAVAADLRWNFAHRPVPPLVIVNAGPQPPVAPVPEPDDAEPEAEAFSLGPIPR